jgi:hypothetical protein
LITLHLTLKPLFELLRSPFLDFMPNMPPLDTSTLDTMPGEAVTEAIKPKSSTTSTGTNTQPPVDPALLSFGQSVAAEDGDLAIDPALFAIEQVVEDVRKGKVNLYNDEANGHGNGDHEAEEDGINAHASGSAGGQHDLEMLDEEFDPALREIVNSLTNAQQVRDDCITSPRRLS